MDKNECSAVRRNQDETHCLNGFPINAACLGTKGRPMCLNEEWCGMAYEQTGSRPKVKVSAKGRLK
jgi:hypothetical protein